MSADVITKGFAHLERRIEKMRIDIEKNKDRAARAAAEVVKVAIKAESPTGHSGRHKLRSSVRVVRFSAGWVVGPTAFYRRFVIRGHGPVKVNGGREVPKGAERAQSAFHRSHRQGPAMAKRSLSFAGVARASSPGGTAHDNPYVNRALMSARGEARTVAGAVLLHDAPDLTTGD